MRPASTVALVGESGSGKSVVSQSILRILPRNGEITRGSILFADPRGDGEPIDLDPVAGRRAGDAGDPRRPHLDHLSGADELAVAAAHDRRPGRRGVAAAPQRDGGRGTRADASTCCAWSGFPIRGGAWRSYPFELSGGLRQRAMIAMALVCRPALLIADEPTTALDVTIQAQILKLIVELQHELGMAVLLITHDLGVVANVAEEIVVMYHGEVMESGTLDDIFARARHPYLRALLRAVPRFDMQPGERLVPIREIPPGDAPHLMARGAGVAGGRHRAAARMHRHAQELRVAQRRPVPRRARARRSSRSTASACRSRAANASASSARAAAARRP